MNKPNFFIVGAPKCGTTSLSEYLRTNPNVFISSPKEPYYFSRDLKLRSWPSEETYLRTCFDGCDNRHWAVGEASAWYLYSSHAVSMILEFNPQAKFIVMIRNPADMYPSVHSQLLYERQENVGVEAAWNLQELREAGEKIPLLCREPKLLQYGDACKLGQQLRRLYELVSDKQVKVIVFDDFVNDTKGIYEDVLRFLDVPLDGSLEFPVFNENKKVRSEFLANLIAAATMNRPVMGLFKATKRATGIRALGLSRSNYVTLERPQMRTPFREELIQFFRDDVEELADLIGRDPSNWTKSGK